MIGMFLFTMLNLNPIVAKSCIIFYTGGSNSMSHNLYSDFLSTFQDIDIYKIPFKENDSNIINKFFNELNDNYDQINLMGHSSGCVRVINHCNPSVKKIILLDPVKTFNFDKTKDLNYLDDVLIVNAEKAYKWSKIPPFVPFIPGFKIDEIDINIDRDKVKRLNVKDYGHCDIIDKPWRNIMHYSRLSIGHNNRNNIRVYHKFLSNMIIKFINYYPNKIGSLNV